MSIGVPDDNDNSHWRWWRRLRWRLYHYHRLLSTKWAQEVSACVCCGDDHGSRQRTRLRLLYIFSFFFTTTTKLWKLIFLIVWFVCILLWTQAKSRLGRRVERGERRLQFVNKAATERPTTAQLSSFKVWHRAGKREREAYYHLRKRHQSRRACF